MNLLSSLSPEQFVEQKLGGDLLCNNPETPHDIWPSPVKQQWLQLMTYNMLLVKEQNDLAPKLQEFNISPVVLKGMALLDSLYEDPGQRQISDMDWLIEPDDYSPIKDILLSGGYSIESEAKWRANSFKVNFFKNHSCGQPIIIELHQHLFYKEPKDFIWRTKNHSTTPYRVLQDEEQIVHLMGHLAYQHSFLRLLWLVDIDRWIRKTKNTLDWDRVQYLIEQLQHKQSTSAVLWSCSKFFQTPLPQEIREAYIYPFDYKWRPILSSDFLLNPSSHPLRYYLIKHLVKDKFIDSLSYDWHWLRHQLGMGS